MSLIIRTCAFLSEMLSWSMQIASTQAISQVGSWRIRRKAAERLSVTFTPPKPEISMTLSAVVCPQTYDKAAYGGLTSRETKRRRARMAWLPLPGAITRTRIWREAMGSCWYLDTTPEACYRHRQP